MQVICCTNLTPIHIGSVKSEVRILGTESEQGVVLLLSLIHISSARYTWPEQATSSFTILFPNTQPMIMLMAREPKGMSMPSAIMS